MLLRESLGNINCQTTMIAHISDSPSNYLETLTTVQLASRIHRTRKKPKVFFWPRPQGLSQSDSMITMKADLKACLLPLKSL